MALAFLAPAAGQRLPQTPNSQPDLEGIWTNATVTPLERPAELSGKPVFTDREAAQFEEQVIARNNTDRRDANPDTDVNQGYNNLWWKRASKVIPTRRTSLIVDPPDGQVPAAPPEAQKRMEATRAYSRQHATHGPEDRPLSKRLDSRPHAPASIRHLRGDLRSQWEGRTLVPGSAQIPMVKNPDPIDEYACQGKLRHGEYSPRRACGREAGESIGGID